MAIFQQINGTPYMYSGSGGGGGHEILNPSGTEMEQRPNLKFTGASVTVTDDSTNDTTVVNVSAGYIVYPTFSIGSDGHLTATGGQGVDFAIDQYGHLIATPQ